MMSVYVCGPSVDENRLEYIYWEYSRIYPRRRKKRNCEFCARPVSPKRLFLLRKMPNREYWRELADRYDVMTILSFERTYLCCDRCVKRMTPKREGIYGS